MIGPAAPVFLPLLAAALLSALNKRIPSRIGLYMAIATSIAVGWFCIELMLESSAGAIVYWFGNWLPHGGVALGISFVIEPLNAALALLVSLLVVAALIFSSKYFDSVGTLYHVLMLIFLGAMCGFSLTGDLFNLFVFFELMSAAAYALCGYKSEEPGPLAGSLNFAIVNTAAAYLTLCGIGLIYSETGALNLAQIGSALQGKSTPLLAIAFIFTVSGFLTKAAIAPFHFWLADAHAVAPTPVCVLFSGVMVEVGLYATARVYWTIFANPFAAHRGDVRLLFLGMGTTTALIAGIMCFMQRNIKRLLAFSTISHMGILVIGFGLLNVHALAGAAVYIAGHGLVKAALFMGAGILLHRLESVDEFDLHGRGKPLPATFALFIAGGLSLAGAPPGGIFMGGTMIDSAANHLGYGWVHAISIFVGVITGAAVLRFAAHVFAGWGRRAEPAPRGARQVKEKPETKGGHRRVPLVMTLPALILVTGGVLLALFPSLQSKAEMAAGRFMDHDSYVSRVLFAIPQPALPGRAEPLEFAEGIAEAAGAIALALLWVFSADLRDKLPGKKIVDAPLGLLRAAHSGVVCDYVAWFAFGVMAIGVTALLTFR